jgi:hypothetical protein
MCISKDKLTVRSEYCSLCRCSGKVSGCRQCQELGNKWSGSIEHLKELGREEESDQPDSLGLISWYELLTTRTEPWYTNTVAGACGAAYPDSLLCVSATLSRFGGEEEDIHRDRLCLSLCSDSQSVEAHYRHQVMQLDWPGPPRQRGSG